MTEVAIRQNEQLALAEDQSWWTDRQLAGLRQVGIDKASEGDLLVFFHVCQRTGLDPFARQIHMIGRNAKDGNQWVTKYTIQTGIDGYRLIARRAADRRGVALSYEDTIWFDRDGNEFKVWTKPSAPAAAMVVVLRGGERFPAVANFAEYVQTTREGNPNAIWARMPANQIAKCAEALALRKAFPQDLSGIYTDDEMGQPEPAPIASTATTGADRMRGILGASAPLAPSYDADEPVTVPPESPYLDTSSPLALKMFATLGELGMTGRDDRLAYVSDVLEREVASSKDMTDADAMRVIDAAEAELAQTSDTTAEVPE